MVKIKRAYEPANKNDGYRVLIDRLWPRGIKKSDLKMDEWAKDLAPSTDLRKSFGHDPAKWSEFRKDYQAELRAAKDHVADLAQRARKSTVTLLYSARDEEHNNAVALKSLLDRRLKKAQ